MNPPVSIHNIKNRFGDHVVHDGIDLDVRQGEILGIIGGSGSGKTVLLNSMIGLRAPTEGQVELLGVPLAGASQDELRQLRNQIGVVFQAGALFSALTVLQNVVFPIAELHSLPRTDMESLARLKLQLVGLQPSDAAKLPAELSGGMRTRVALARALALDPTLIFLDEPTAGLDPISSERFVDHISELQRTLNLTVVMVTHDLYTLTALSDRIAVLADRQLVALDTPPRVIDDPHPFIQAYFRTLHQSMEVKDGA